MEEIKPTTSPVTEPVKLPELKPVDVTFDVTNPLDTLLKDDTSVAVQEFFNTQKLKRGYSTAPTAIPYEANDQIYFYESGTTRRLYININGTWRYVLLPSTDSVGATTFASTDFESSSRFLANNQNTGASTWGLDGLAMTTGTTAASWTKQLWTPLGTNTNCKIFANSPTFRSSVFCSALNNASGTAEGITAIGNVFTIGSVLTLTTSHAGFYFQKTGGVTSLYASTGNGSAGTLSSALTTLADNDHLDLMIKFNGTTSIDFYWAKNGTVMSSAINVTATLPSASAQYCTYAVTNNGTAYAFDLTVATTSYER